MTTAQDFGGILSLRVNWAGRQSLQPELEDMIDLSQTNSVLTFLICYRLDFVEIRWYWLYEMHSDGMFDEDNTAV